MLALLIARSNPKDEFWYNDQFGHKPNQRLTLANKVIDDEKSLT